MTVSCLQDRKMLAVPEALLGNSQGAALLGAEQGGKGQPPQRAAGKPLEGLKQGSAVILFKF